MYVDDIKLFVKNEKELETLIQTIRIYSEDIGMEFSIENMCHTYKERFEKVNNGRNTTTKSRKN